MDDLIKRMECLDLELLEILRERDHGKRSYWGYPIDLALKDNSERRRKVFEMARERGRSKRESRTL